MTISFPSLPTSIRLPFAYTEFDPTLASLGASLMPYNVLLFGQKLAEGSAKDYQVCRPISKKQGDDLFGQGSMLSEMCAAYLNANPYTKMLAIPAPDAEEGNAAQGALVLSGTVTEASPLCLYIGGTRVRASAPLGATGADVASNLAAAIAASPDLPVTANNTDGTVTITYKHKGECGNDIDLRIGYQDEPMPGGISAEIIKMGSGAGNPDIAQVIAAMGDGWYQVIACPWTDKASLKALRDELDSRWGPMRQNDGQAIIVRRGTFGDVTTYAAARNDKHLTVLPSEGSPTSPWVDAAASAGIVALYGQSDPARGFNTLRVPGVLAPHEADRWRDYPEKNQGLFEGVSARYVDASGYVCFSSLITTYRLNPLGADDRSFLSLNSPLTLSYLRYDWNNYIKLKYPRHKLASDQGAELFDSEQPIMTPRLGRTEIIARCNDVWVPLGLVENPQDFEKSVVTERNAFNENRLDFSCSPDLVNQFEVAGTLIRHIV